MTKTLLCLGYGYTAQTLAQRLRSRGWNVRGTTRSLERVETLITDGIEGVHWAADGPNPDVFDNVDAVLVSTSPANATCPSLSVVRSCLEENRLSWIGYLSSNGVYGNHNGNWVDENSELRTTTSRGKARVMCEAEWSALAREHNLPLVIFRLPGIYGPGRSAIERVKAGIAAQPYKEGQFFSRAHVDDIATALVASIDNPKAGHLFNIADDEPSPPQDVIEYACSLLGVALPPLVPFNSAELSEMGRSFYGENKRVKNDLMKEKLGVSLKFPSYREGLNAIANC